MSDLTLKEQAAAEGVTPGAIYMRGWRSRNREKWDSYLREYRKQRRQDVLEHYGGRCACCGEDAYEFLAVDHANGGGEAHRAEVGQGSRMVDWIIRSGYPDGFRILCHNCNQSIGYYGECPHARVVATVLGT
jgi:hypothetical protein